MNICCLKRCSTKPATTVSARSVGKVAYTAPQRAAIEALDASLREAGDLLAPDAGTDLAELIQDNPAWVRIRLAAQEVVAAYNGDGTT
jgi:hypothetical protein